MISVQEVYSQLLASYTEPRHRARLLAASSDHSGDHVLPIAACDLHLDNEAMRVAVGLRLGCVLCESHTCRYGATADTLHSRLLLQAQLQQNTTPQLHKWCHQARFDSSRRSQHEGTTRAGGPWRRQAALRFDIATMELRAQRHLVRHSGRHSVERLSAAECHHQCQCRWNCSYQKKKQVQLTQRHPRLFPEALETLWPMSVSTQDFSSWHKSDDVWSRWRRTLVKRCSYFNACRSPSNASTRHA